MDGSNNLRAGGVHRHDDVSVCDRCHTELYGPAKVRRFFTTCRPHRDYQEYGPPPGMESLEERRLNRLSCDMFVIDQKLPSCLQVSLKHFNRVVCAYLIQLEQH